MTSSKPSEVEKKSSSYRYGREEMLAMYAPALPVPSDLRDMTIFCMRELLPMSFLPVTEDEQTALLKCVNSDLAVRSNQRAPPLSQGARTVAGEQKRGRGRGRADASLRNSKANDGRSETSESVCSGDWRKEKGAEKAGGPYGCAGARAPSKSDTSESSGGNNEPNAREDIQAVQCSDRLSYTAATSSSEDVNFKRVHCMIANSINRVVHNNANSEQLDRYKHDPTTTLSYDSVVSSNANSSRNHVVDLRLSNLAPSSDTKHCGGDAQWLSVNYAKGNIMDTNVSSSYGGGFCGDVSRTNLMSDGVIWSKPVYSKASGVPEGVWRNGFLAAGPTTDKWFYKDPNGEIQGPFTSREMEQWFLMGYFPMKLLIRPGQDEEFVLLGDLIKAYGSVPFLSRTDKKEIPLSQEHSVLPDQVNRESRPVSSLPFHQQFMPPSHTYNVPSFLPETVAPPPHLHSQRLEPHLSSAASVASRGDSAYESCWPFNFTGGLNSQIDGNPMVGVDRERIEEDLKKRIEKQLKEKLMLELEREKLRLEQLKIEEERRLMIEHHLLLEDEKKRQEERRKMEDERRQLEEERRKLEELHRKAEEERRLQEHLRMERQREEQEKRMIEDERKMLEKERLELVVLHRKAEGDRRALQQQLLEKMSDDSDDEVVTGNVVSEGMKEEERFEGKTWCTWKEDIDSGDDEQLQEESVLERVEPCDERRGEWRENGAESDMREPEKERKMVEASESLGEEMQGPNQERNCAEKGLSLKSIHETKKKLVAWNSSSKNETQCTPTSPVVKCPWATSAPPSVVSSQPSQPSAETQDIGQVKEDELQTTSEAQKQRLNVVQQQKKQMSFNWKEQRTEASAQSKVQSFLEIQEEQAKQEQEDEKKRKQQQLQQQQQQLGKVPIKMKPQKPNTGNVQPPRRIKAAAAAKADMPVSISTSSLLGTPGGVPGLMSVPVAATVPYATQPWNPTKGPPMSPTAEMNEFMVWCHRALPTHTTNSSVDVPTLIDFLKDVESPYELYDYIRLYLGESKQSMDFAHEFLERRRRLQMRVNRATLGFRFTPVYPSFAFGYQTGMFYQPYSGNMTLQPDKANGQKMML